MARFSATVRAPLCVLLLAALALAGCGSSTPSLPPAHLGPESILQAPAALVQDPVGTLAAAKKLGVDRMRQFVFWRSIAPDPTASAPPAHFNPADPADYPAANWVEDDTIVRDAAAQGVGLDLTLSGPAPDWAATPGAPGGPAGVWKPSASAFGEFVRAVATRYSGHYRPPGAAHPLPRVDFWAIWNEPNYGVELAPQTIDHASVEVAPALYRGLVNAAWSALHAAGHGGDTILIDELAPRGQTTGDLPGNYGGMVPLRFLRALYCVDGSYKILRGTAAQERQCPTTSAGTAAFRRENPALFQATGVAVHPYPQGVPPNVIEPGFPDYADLASVSRLEETLDRLQKDYGSSKRFDIYDTEFGYQTNPPETIGRAISPKLAAYYLNWSEFLHYRDPRIRSYDQYLLTDPTTVSFDTGLETANGMPLATFYAFRMPLYLPITSASSGTKLEIWGCVRPAHYAQLQTGQAQNVQIQFQAHGQGPFRTIETVPVTNAHGYFDVLRKLPSSGNLRTSWAYPHGATVFSRTVAVTLH